MKKTNYKTLRQQPFLSRLRINHGNIVMSAREVGVSATCVYGWMQRDESFATKVEEIRNEDVQAIMEGQP